VSRVVEELLGHELAIAPSFDQGVQGPPAVGGARWRRSDQWSFAPLDPVSGSLGSGGS
jgi:hypothetical protein